MPSAKDFNERTMRGMDDSQHHLDRFGDQSPERPARMSFAEQVVEAIDGLVAAKIDYAETRQRLARAEYAHTVKLVETAQARLTVLLGKVRYQT